MAILFGMTIMACQKEYSFEGSYTGESNGSLKDSSGNCHQMVLAGKYEVDTPLNGNNYVLAKVNFNSIGKWFIKSDTVNGIWFLDSGYTTILGLQTLRIQGYGMPILPIVFDMNLYFRNSTCKFVCNSSGTPITPQPLIRDYFPTTFNSNWTFFSSTINDTIISTILANTNTINGLLYNQLEVYTPLLANRDTIHIRKDGLGNYYRYYAIATTGPNRDHVFLKDYEPVGTTWESPIVNLVYAGIPTQGKYRFTVLARNVNATVNSRNYDSVIKVKEESMFLIMGNFQTINTNEHWYAKNIGPLSYIQVNPISPQKISLRRYKVY